MSTKMKFLAFTSLIALAIGSFGFGQARAIDSSSEEITACVLKKNGATRIITGLNGGRCYSGETPMIWSMQGPSGPQGLRGEKGDSGIGYPEAVASLTDPNAEIKQINFWAGGCTSPEEDNCYVLVPSGKGFSVSQVKGNPVTVGNLNIYESNGQTCNSNSYYYGYSYDREVALFNDMPAFSFPAKPVARCFKFSKWGNSQSTEFNLGSLTAIYSVTD